MNEKSKVEVMETGNVGLQEVPICDENLQQFAAMYDVTHAMVLLENGGKSMKVEALKLVVQTRELDRLKP